MQDFLKSVFLHSRLREQEMGEVDQEDEWQDGFDLEEVDKDDDAFKWVCGKMKNTKAEHVWGSFQGYQILKLSRVKNSELYEKYRKKRKEIFLETGKQRVKEVRLFHGTTHALEIARNGFRVELASITGMFGKGLYFTDCSSKGNQYTFEGFREPCEDHDDILCEICVRRMLICKVALGKEYHTDSEMKGITKPPKGFHCVVGDKGDNLHFCEYVIYDNSQAYPGYLVEYKLRK